MKTTYENLGAFFIAANFTWATFKLSYSTICGWRFTRNTFITTHVAVCACINCISSMTNNRFNTTSMRWIVFDEHLEDHSEFHMFEQCYNYRRRDVIGEKIMYKRWNWRAGLGDSIESQSIHNDFVWQLLGSLLCIPPY